MENNRIDIYVPTWDFIKKYDKEIDRATWILYYSPYGPFANVEKLMAMNEFMDTDRPVRLAVINSNFNPVIDDIQKFDITEVVENHVDNLSDEDFVKIFNENNLKEGYRLNFLGLRMYFDNNPWKYYNQIPEDVYTGLVKYFGGIFGKENILIRNELMTALEVYNNIENMYEEMISHMNGNKEMALNPRTIDDNQLPYVDLYLPVMTKYVIENPLMILEDFMFDSKANKFNVNCLSSLIGFEEKALKAYGVETDYSFEQSDVCKNLLSSMTNRTELMLNQFIPDYYLPEFHNNQIEGWNKYVKEMNSKNNKE